ncbi:MAG: beta-ketoacyl-[acyl-carrier-protein] synthase family protein, partial [Allomuricauda sp.]
AKRKGGPMTAHKREAVIRCIRSAVQEAEIPSDKRDVINGHLTATTKDPLEIQNWSKALGRSGEDFPYVNSFKGLFGHCLAAAGSIECVGSLLQFKSGQVFGNLNCEDLHPEIEKIVDPSRIPQTSLDVQPKIIAKASFGFGDVNACVIFKSHTN